MNILIQHGTRGFRYVVLTSLLLGISGIFTPVSRAEAAFVTNTFTTDRCPFVTYDMVRGSTDAGTSGQVSKVQAFLRLQNMFIGQTTGTFGPSTEKSLKKWQEYMGIASRLKKPGALGPQTREAMNSLCAAAVAMGDVFTTPSGTPTIRMPAGWNVVVRTDMPLVATEANATEKTMVVFSDVASKPKKGLVFLIRTHGGASFESIEQAARLQEQNGPRKLVSMEQTTLYGFKGLVIRREIDDDTIDGYALSETRMFVTPSYVVSLTGIVEMNTGTWDDVDRLFASVFKSISVPQFGGVAVNDADLQSKVVSLTALYQELSKPRQIAPGSFTSPYCPVITYDLQSGDNDRDTGGQVSSFQKFLAAHYGIPTQDVVTGFYGDKTAVYAVRFQREMGLQGLGGVGEKTRAALAKCVQK